MLHLQGEDFSDSAAVRFDMCSFRENRPNLRLMRKRLDSVTLCKTKTWCQVCVLMNSVLNVLS
jgi:hypothetical protein